LQSTFRELKLGAERSFESLITNCSERKMEAAGFSEPLIRTRLYGVIREDYSSYLRRPESLSSHIR
jgi:hypothetical protein